MLRQGLLLAVAFGVAFFSAAAVLHAWVPPPDHDDMDTRLAWFADHRDEFDLVFIGSSNFRPGIAPRRVDESLARLGHPIRSFNFGVQGMNAFEGRQLLERVLALHPERLRWVVIEFLHIRASEVIGRNPWTDRVVGWHDLRRTAEVIESLRRARLDASERFQQILLHLRHLAWNLSNIGQGPRTARALLGLDGDERAEAYQRISENLGFRPLGIYRSAQGPEARRTLERDWARKMARFERTRHSNTPTSIFDPAPMRRQIAQLEARGIEPIYVISPVGRGTPLADRLIAQGIVPKPLIYNRPERYPALYDVENRFDVTHLNAQGARIWSPILAEGIARRMDEGEARKAHEGEARKADEGEARKADEGEARKADEAARR